METVKRVRFAQNDILIMLREIVSCNPLENPARWKNVQQNLNAIAGKNFALRAIKSHANSLVLKWIKEERMNRAKSGIEEIHTEKEVLLQNVFDLMQQFRHINKEENDKKDSSVKGQLDRDVWATASHDHDYDNPTPEKEDIIIEEVDEHDDVEGNQEIIEKIDEDPPIRVSFTPTMKVTSSKRKILVPSQNRAKRYPLKKGALDYLSSKQEKQLQIRSRELELEEKKLVLEERRLVLEEKKFAAENTEREVRWQMERERHEVELSERKQLQQNFDFQQRLIEKLLQTKM